MPQPKDHGLKDQGIGASCIVISGLTQAYGQANLMQLSRQQLYRFHLDYLAGFSIMQYSLQAINKKYKHKTIKGIKQYLGTSRAKCHYLGLTIWYRRWLKQTSASCYIYIVQPRISHLKQHLTKGYCPVCSLQYLVHSLCIPSRKKA